MTSETFIIDESLSGFRLDVAIAQTFPEHSRTYAINQIKNGFVLVDGIVIKKPAYRVEFENEVEVSPLPVSEVELKAENIPLDIIYEDQDIIVINKEAGLVVHPGPGHRSGTLVNALLYHVQDLSGMNGRKRPGIVHRIDKDTTGLILVCKNDVAHEFIAQQLKERSMGRKYYALVNGVIKEEEGKIIAPLARDKKDRLKMSVDLEKGKSAITNFQVLERFRKYTLVEASLESGRTHQIRVHFDYIGHPLEGDPLYGVNNMHLTKSGQLLHAHQLNFIHPRSKKKMSLEAPFPEHFKAIINKLRES